jgi:SsrA-binding protein
MQSTTDKEIINKKARHDYIILTTHEAGIQLKGWEVKSLRLGRASLKDAHVRFINNEAFLVHAHITPYQFTRTEEVDETRSRKLLLHKAQMAELKSSAEQQGLTIIPLKIYLKETSFKSLIGLARGKKVYEKRAVLRERDIARDVAKDLKWKDR